MGRPEEDIAPYGVDTEAGRKDEIEQQQVARTRVTTWKGYIWDTWELPKAERKLLFKVDAFVLTFASVSRW